MSSSWIEYISDFGAKLSTNIDDYGRFFEGGGGEDLSDYSKTGVLILSQEIRDRYPIFSGPLVFTENGYGLNYEGVTIEISFDIGDGYLIRVNIIFPNDYRFYSIDLKIPRNLKSYRKDAVDFYNNIISAIDRIPFIRTTNEYVKLISGVNSMRKFIPSDLELLSELDVLQLVNVILSASFTIDKL